MQVPVDSLQVPKKVVELPKPVVDKLAQRRDSAFSRFPLFFTLMAAFGLVATTDGFTRLISKVPLLANNPYITLAVGLVALLITGTLYRKL